MKKVLSSILSMFCAEFLICNGTTAAEPAFVPFGVVFTPFTDQRYPLYSPPISEQDLAKLLGKIQGQSQWIRTLTQDQGMESIGALGHQFGFKTAVGAWLVNEWTGSLTTTNLIQVTNLIAAANRGEADLVIVGSQSHKNKLERDRLVYYLNLLKGSVPATVPVTTVEDCDVFISDPELMSLCDIVLTSIDPLQEGVRIDNAVSYVDEKYTALSNAAYPKEVWIGETSWPALHDNQFGSAVINEKNQAYYFRAISSWASARGIKLFYYGAFDDNWRLIQPEDNRGELLGELEGIRTSAGKLKPYIAQVYAGHLLPDTAYLRTAPPLIPGRPSIVLTKLPPYGSYDDGIVEGRVIGFDSLGYSVVVYIHVFGGWWSKPYFSNPVTFLDPLHGTFSVNTVTGGYDYAADEYIFFVVPRSYSPPLANGGGIPSDVFKVAAIAGDFSRPPGSPGVVTNIFECSVTSLGLKRSFAPLKHTRDSVVISVRLPITHTQLTGLTVDIRVSGVDWRFDTVQTDGTAHVTGGDLQGAYGTLAIKSGKSFTTLTANLTCPSGNTTWNEYGLVNASLGSPGIPMFVPVSIGLGGTNYYGITSGYYRSFSNHVGWVSCSVRTTDN